MIAAPSVNMLFYHRGGHRFAFVWDDSNRTEILRQLGRWAARPDVPLSWCDAALLSQRIREMREVSR